MVHLRRYFFTTMAVVAAVTIGPLLNTGASASDTTCSVRDGRGCGERGDERSEREHHGRGEHDGSRHDDCPDESPSSSSSSSIANRSGDDGREDEHHDCTMPPPVVPESRWPVLLPISAAGTAVVVLRHRRARPKLA